MCSMRSFIRAYIVYIFTVVEHGQRAIKTSALCIFRRHKLHANGDYFSTNNNDDDGDDDDTDKAAIDFSVFFALKILQ